MILVYILCFMSIISFILYGLDKRKAIKHRWRISEASLLLSSLFGGIGGLTGMLVFHHKTRKWKFRILVPMFALLQFMIIIFLVWTADYYHADETAIAAMQSGHDVTVTKTSTGWLFDGPSEENAFIFYPGAKVDEKAYAPLLYELAEKGTDAYLVKMPFHLAFLGINKADEIIKNSDYENYYIGGHSLGGAMAASYAAKKEAEKGSTAAGSTAGTTAGSGSTAEAAADDKNLTGLILLAAYPTDELGLKTLLIYGSEDGVLNIKLAENTEELIAAEYDKYVITGGNHAQFGNYGEQKGDGNATISNKEQQEITIEKIEHFMLQ